ncbi:uncharacterized protein STEHIDRAFT_163046 [Stereum hirsutum FP-91666 SS1]|uniref:Uncharacterized protein n=1 Tax=Stereum hirsutum (strain FP-91666) TaxID=721885 RepID=R7RXN5_STEHR|nr:uncharacterized protein STEHIDRAFT_163046 [Stereum hirsutum FP-91666 SS1]EIM80171.1 hypothetical protein STEHIDRAFT_163046 [Stereum hirsutum FP-91666 SS1]
MSNPVYHPLSSDSSNHAGHYGMGAPEWSTMFVGQCNGVNGDLHRYEREQLARWADQGQVGPIVCVECHSSCLCFSSFANGATSLKCPAHGDFTPMVMTPELKRFLGITPGLVGAGFGPQMSPLASFPPVRPVYQGVSGFEPRQAPYWQNRQSFYRSPEAIPEIRAPVGGGRTAVVVGEGTDRGPNEQPSATAPSPRSGNVATSDASNPPPASSAGSVTSSRRSHHDQDSCPFLHGWQKPVRLQLSSPLVKDMSPETRAYLRKWGTKIFLHWMRDADFLDDLLLAGRPSQPSSSSSSSSHSS